MSTLKLEDVKKVVVSYFPKLWRPLEACLSTVATLMIKNNSNPTSIILEGVPSSGKGTVLDFLRDLKMVYWSDHFTPKSFVSHYANKDKEALNKVDFLQRVKQKCLIVPDFGVLFGKRADDVKENLGILTRVLDGQGLSIDTGVHGQRKIDGDCNLAFIGATTPFGYQLWDAMTQFGSRLLFLHLPEEKQLDDLADEFIKTSCYGEDKEICRKVVGEYFDALWENAGGYRGVTWKNADMPREVVHLVGKLAILLTKLRGMISLWSNKDDSFEYKKPTIENPRRVMTLLLNVAKGRALLCGRNQISMEDMPLVLDILLSSAPEDRCFVLREFLRTGGDILYASDIRRVVDVSEKTALMIMENLKILKIAVAAGDNSSDVGRPKKGIRLANDIADWFLTDSVRELFSQIDESIYSYRGKVIF